MQRRNKRGMGSKGGERGVPARANNASYSLGNIVEFGGFVHKCIFPVTGTGAAGAVEPTVIAPLGVVTSVTNGEFTADTDWTKGVGTTISGGKCHLVAASLLGVYQPMGMAVDKAWVVSGELSNVSAGTLGILAGGTSINYAADGAILGSANGPFTSVLETFGLAGANGLGILGSDGGSAFTGSLDNLVVIEGTLDGGCVWQTISNA